MTVSGLGKVLTIIEVYRAAIAVITTMAMGFASLWGIRFALGVGEAGAFPTATRAMQCGTRATSAVSFRESVMRPAGWARRWALL